MIFTARQADTAALEKKIEARLHEALGYEVATFVRTCAEVAAVAGYQPFPAAAIEDDATVYVGFVDRPLDAAAARAVMAFKTEVDDFRVKGREVYWLRKTRQSRLAVQVRQPGKETEDPRDLPRHQHRGAAGGETRSVMILL